MDENPLRLQYRPKTGRFTRATPLVLIHDAGGTTYSYLRLGSLNRDVWAIQDPYFETAKPWNGGFEEMAERYVQLIESAGIRGPILLGGWSLGGYVSLAIANRLLNTAVSKLFVVGILLIDSPIHIPLCKLPACGPDPDFSDLPEMVRKSFDKFDAMLYMCELPTWDSPACQGKTVRVSAGKETFEVDAGSMLHRSKDGDWRPVALGNSQDGHVATEKFTGPPPAALVRCLRRTPTGKPSQGPSHVDRYRDDLLLGWEGRHQSFIKAVVDVDSHHFNVLDVSHAGTMTQHINDCLNIIDNLQIA